MNKIRLFLNLILFSALVLSTSLQAGISPLAFNGVFECFKPGYEVYAPNLGCAVLQTEIINNIRFCMVNPGKKDAHGNRLWIEDKAPADDPVAALAILLFPSPAGNLTAMTSHKTNLGKDLNVIHIAQLLNFCAHVRALIHNIGSNKFGASGSKCLNLLASLAQPAHKPYFKNFLANTFNFKKNDPTISQANMLISALCKIIELEEKSTNQNLENFYPKFQAEQLLNAFFCLKFGTQDIPTLLAHLDDSIVYRDVVNELTTIPLIKKSYIEQAAQKNIEQLTLDDLWALQNQELVDQVIPYPRNCTPVNNGLAYAYNRTQDQLIQEQDFPDCTETVIRHLCNLLLYSKELHSFDLSFLKNQLKESPYLKNLEGFYAFQTPDKANSGDLSVRNAWSKVIGGLGHPVRYKKKSVASKLQNDTEISSGIINIMRVLNIIFDLQIEVEPIYANDQQFAQDVAAWAQAGLETMFQLISPDKEITIEISSIQAFKAFGDYEYDCLCTIQMQVNNGFEFAIDVKNGHAEFTSLTILVPQLEIIIPNALNSIKEKFRPILQGTVGQSLFVLDAPVHEPALAPLYDLFQNGINDSTHIMETLNHLLTLTTNNVVTLSHAKTILRNCLQMFLWQDFEMMKKIQPILRKWKDFADKENNIDLINVLQEEVIGIRYDFFSQDFQNNADEVLNFFNNASFVFYLTKKNQNNVSSFNMTQRHESIKEIDFANTKITELILSGEACPNLTTLNLHNNGQLSEFKLVGVFEKLTEVNLVDSPISEFEISEKSCPNLEILNLTNNPNQSFRPQIEKLQLSETFNQLKNINLCGAAIKELTIYAENFPKLEKLNVCFCNRLQTLNLNGIFKNLQEIQLVGSNLNELSLPGAYPSLQFLNLDNISTLKNIILTGTFNALTSLNLSSSKIIDLAIDAHNFPNLKFLELRYTKNLKNLTLSGVFTQLCWLNCNSSGIKELELCGTNLPNITELNVSAVKKLMLSQTFNKLKTLNLYEAALEELYICAKCPKLKSLDLRNTSQLKKVDLLGNLKKLHEIKLSDKASTFINVTRKCKKLTTNDPRIKFTESNQAKRILEKKEEPDSKKSCRIDSRLEEDN